MSIIINPFLVNRSVNYLFIILITLSLSIDQVYSRTCETYIDSFGRERKRCRSLIGGGIAGVVIGGVVLIGLFIFILFALRRRRLAKQVESNRFPQSNNLNQSYNPPPGFPPPPLNPNPENYYTHQDYHTYQPPTNPMQQNEKLNPNSVQVPPPTFNHY